MRGAQRRTDEAKSPAVPPLAHGQRLTQKEFHRRYEAYPEDVKFELIGGVVYMASPLRRSHGLYHVRLESLLSWYADATPGVEVLDNTTNILGDDSEPQPDISVRILAEYGGQSRETVDDYVEGPPELLAEIAYSSRDIDLGVKRNDYERAGIIEYIVVLVEEQQLRWFHFPSQTELRPGQQGLWKSKVFPGLWIDEPALMANQSRPLMARLAEGLASPGHVRLVKRLAAARRRSQA